MAKYQVTYQNRVTGKDTVMTVEAVSASNAQDIGSYFEASHGKMVTKGTRAPKLAPSA